MNRLLPLLPWAALLAVAVVAAFLIFPTWQMAVTAAAVAVLMLAAAGATIAVADWPGDSASHVATLFFGISLVVTVVVLMSLEAPNV